MTPVSSVVLQHSDEAPFIWGLRSGAVAAPRYSLADLAKLDSRVDAHLDGLRIAGEDGWQLCRKELAWEEPSEVFVAAVLAFESGDERRVSEVVHVGSTKADLARGLVSALGWLAYQQAEPHINKLLASESAVLRRIGIAAAAIHRKDPGKALADAASDPDLLLKARALRAIGELGRLDLLRVLRENLNHEDEACRFAAAWSLALLSGDTNAVGILKATAESQSPHREPALQMAARTMDLAMAHSWRAKLAGNASSLGPAVILAGAIGDSVLVPWLIERMKIAPLARVAGEAFSMITGVDIAYQDLDGEKPEGFESGPNEDPNDENVEMDPDENLPWPDPIAIEQWWQKHRSEITPGIRYFLGKPVSAEWLQQVLRIGRQRQRAAAALELAILNPGQPLFNVKAPGFRQQRLLGLDR
jgi:uncharacterized protein (TIGR02270 family)